MRRTRDLSSARSRHYAIRAHPAAADAHHDLGAIALDALGLPEVGDEPVIRLLADRAGVEQDQIRLLATRRLAVAERLEHPLHPLGVVLVHLAAEGGDVVALHRRPRVTAARLSPGGIRARPARLSLRSRSSDRWPDPAPRDPRRWRGRLARPARRRPPYA